MNKLRRKVEITYIPGDPPVPPTPPVCTTTTKRVETSGRTGSSRIGSSSSGSGISEGGMYIPVYGTPRYNPVTGQFEASVVGFVNAREPSFGGVDVGTSSYTTRTTTTCVGGSPGKPGTPGRVARVAAGPDWQASARSIARRSGDFAASFNVSAKPRIAAGLASTDTGPNFADLRLGVLLRTAGQTTLVVPIIDGREQAQVGSYVAGDRVALIRAGGRFKIQVGGVTMYDAPNSDVDLGLDVLLYTSDDYVEDPALADAEVVTGVGGTVGLRAALSTATSVNGTLGVTGAVGSLVDGVVVAQVSGQVGLEVTASSVGTQQVSVSGAIGLSGELGAMAETALAALSLPAFEMVAADDAYLRGTVSLPAMTMSANLGAPSMEVTGADLSLPSFGFYALTNTGGTLTLEQDLPALMGLASDRVYAQGEMTLPALVMSADDGYTLPGYAIHIENMNLFSEIYTDPSMYASIEFGLEMEPTMSIGTLVSGSYFEGLLLDPSLSLDQFINAMIQSGVNLSSATQAPVEGFGQYGFNLETAAATRYEGFDFRGFAHTAGGTYAFKKDGLYRLRAGDDDGQYRSAMVDFGISGMGVLEKKHIDVVYLGMSTDGRVYLKMAADEGEEKTYRVIQRQPTMKVRTGRGLTAREWATKLEVVDSSAVELDGIEFVVAVTGRKWVR